MGSGREVEVAAGVGGAVVATVVDLLAGGGTGDGGPGDDNVGTAIPYFSWNVAVQPTYILPAGTTAEWRYVPGSGHCIESVIPHFQDTLPGNGKPYLLFSTPVPTKGFEDLWDVCTYTASRGTWQTLITTPNGGPVYRGSLEFWSGTVTPPPLPYHHGSVECHDYDRPGNGGLKCKGGTDLSVGQGTVIVPVRLG